MIKSIIQNRSGLSALITIIVISAVAMIVATTAALTAMDQTQSGLDESKSLEVSVAAQSCLEHGLLRLKLDPDYLGEELFIDSIHCSISREGKIIEIKANDENKYYSTLKKNV